MQLDLLKKKNYFLNLSEEKCDNADNIEKCEHMPGNSGCSIIFSSHFWVSIQLLWLPAKESDPSRTELWPTLASFSLLPNKHTQTWSESSSVTQLCPTLCDPMDCSMPGFPVHHQLPELAQTHVHRVCYAIQPSHPLSSPSHPAFSLSQHQGLFK